MYSSVVVIAGVARSGTSWLGEILDSSPSVAYRFQPIFSYAFKNVIHEDSPRDAFEKFFRDIYESKDDYLLQSDKREVGLFPTFAKLPAPNCLVWKEARHQYLLGRMLRLFPNIQALFIIRHPCAVINSWMRNPKEFPPGSDQRVEWRFGACKNQGQSENFFGYYKWKEAAHMYLDLAQQLPRQTRVIRYKDLVDNTLATVNGIFDFVGLQMTEQTTQFLVACHSVHKDSPYSVYRNRSVKDAWKTQLDPYIADEILRDLRSTRLEPFLE